MRTTPGGGGSSSASDSDSGSDPATNDAGTSLSGVDYDGSSSDSSSSGGSSSSSSSSSSRPPENNDAGTSLSGVDYDGSSGGSSSSSGSSSSGSSGSSSDELTPDDYPDSVTTRQSTPNYTTEEQTEAAIDDAISEGRSVSSSGDGTYDSDTHSLPPSPINRRQSQPNYTGGTTPIGEINISDPTADGIEQADLEPDQRQDLRQQAAANSALAPGEIRIGERDGEYVAYQSPGSVRRDTEEEIANELGVDESGVVVDESGEVGLTPRGESEYGLETRIEAAQEFDAFGVRDLEADVQEGGQVDVNVTERAERERAQSIFADELGVPESEVDVTEEGDGYAPDLSRDAREQLLVDQVQNEYDASRDDISITEENGELQAQIQTESEPQGALDTVRSFASSPIETAQEGVRETAEPVTEFADDPFGTLEEGYETGVDRAQSVADDVEEFASSPFEGMQEGIEDTAEPVTDFVSDPSGTITEQYGDEIDRAESAVSGAASFGSDVVDEASESQTGKALAAGAPVAAAEPTPIGEGALGVAALGLGVYTVGSAAADQLDEGGEPTVQTETASMGEVEAPTDPGQWQSGEMSIPDGSAEWGQEEMSVPDEPTAGTQSEMGVPDGAATQTQSEIDAPASGGQWQPPEVDVPTESVGTFEIGLTGQQLIGEQIQRERPADEADDQSVITGEDLVDPDRLRREEMEELRQQVEEQAEYSQGGSEPFADQDAFLFPGGAEASVDQSDTSEAAEEPSVSEQSVFGQGVGTQPQLGPLMAPQTDVAEAVDVQSMQGLGLGQGQAQAQAQTQAQAQAEAVGEQFAQPTAPEAVGEPYSYEYGTSEPGGRQPRRLPDPFMLEGEQGDDEEGGGRAPASPEYTNPVASGTEDIFGTDSGNDQDMGPFSGW